MKWKHQRDWQPFYHIPSPTILQLTFITNKHYISPACTTSLVQLPTGADWAFFLDLAPPTESFEFLILSFTCVHKLDDEQARTGPNPLFHFRPIYIEHLCRYKEIWFFIDNNICTLSLIRDPWFLICDHPLDLHLLRGRYSSYTSPCPEIMIQNLHWTRK